MEGRVRRVRASPGTENYTERFAPRRGYAVIPRGVCWPRLGSFLAVDYASDGERGSYLARTNEYDLILVDQILPKKSGLEIIKEVRGQ